MCHMSLDFLYQQIVRVANAVAQVEWNNPGDPTKGFKYIYLSDSDYSSIAARADTAVLKAVPFFAENGAAFQCPHVFAPINAAPTSPYMPSVVGEPQGF